MYSEMIIVTEGDYFWTDSNRREEITEGQAITYLANWELERKQVKYANKFDGLVEQYWID